MKKLLFRKFFLDFISFFLTILLIISLIVWTIQAINYFDFVTQDGHGFKVYFQYTFLNFPKIIHRILPFVYFLSLYSMLIRYENKNQLNIFWIHGISKLQFAKKLLNFSIIIMIIQITFGTFISPSSQLKARNYLKNSNIDFMSNLIREGKFVSVVKNLTIFVENKIGDGLYSNIFIEDTNNQNSRMIFANNGYLVDQKILKLINGKIIDRKNENINIFNFQQININLDDYISNTITMPKIQEVNIKTLLKCYEKGGYEQGINFDCDKSILNEIKQELLKRIFKPIYIPIITIICCFIMILSNKNINYKNLITKVFVVSFSALIISEATLRYSTSNITSMILYFLIPILIFNISYLKFYRLSKNA